MSDSESSVELEQKVEQEHEAKVRELIERAKKTLPAYSEESLINIYKESFQSENVFLNKLDIIIRQQRLLQEETNGHDEWHYSKKGERPATQQRRDSPERTREVRPKYNFLEDAKLIERALKFRRNEPQRERPQQFREKVENKDTQPRERQEYKKEKVNQSYKEKKLLYKQKEEGNSPVKNEQKPIVQLPQKVEKPAEKVEKAEKVAEKVPQKAVEKVAEKVEKAEPKLAKGCAEKKLRYAQKKEPSKPQVKEAPKEQPKPVEAIPQKKAENHVKAPEVKSVTPPPQQAPTPVKTQQLPKPAPKVEATPEPIIIEQKKVVPAPVLVKAATEEPKVQSSKKIDSQKEIKVLDPEVEREFQSEISKNSFILKFIRPSNKLQKVSYIRTVDGGCKDVKVREPLPLEHKN